MKSESLDLLDSLLVSSTVEEALAVGNHRDDKTNKFNQLTNAELRELLADAGYSWPGDKELARGAVRYIVEQAFAARSHNTEKANRVAGQLAVYCKQRGIKHLTEEDTAMTEETIETTEETPSTTTTKKPRKAAKNAKTTKGAKKAAKAPKAKKAAASTEEGRTDSRSLRTVRVQKMPKEGEMPLQAVVLCEVLKSLGKVTIAEFLEKLEKSKQLATKQPAKAIWAFYRRRLIDEGYVVVSE